MEIEDCIDWLQRYHTFLPKKYEDIRYEISYRGKTIKDLKNRSVLWGFSPEAIMSEYLYDTMQLDEFKEYMREYVAAFYLRMFEMFYTELEWWKMFVFPYSVY
jgi:hypothetical protein